MTKHEFKNEELGITAFVAERADGKFASSLRDDDSGEFIPTVNIYLTEERAVASAKKAAGIN